MISQTTFRAGLLDPSQPVPEGLSDGENRPAGRRYGVYRNNVTVSLREALADGFPSIVGLIGRDNFEHVARAYLRQSPPTSPLMMHYGATFPDFLADLEQLAHLPYLADVARIDVAMRQSYHAADSVGIEPTALQDMDETTLLNSRFTFAPSMILIRSPWPIGSIWRYTLRGGDKPTGIAEDVLILRAEFDPEPHVLGTEGADVLIALQGGHTFREALEPTGDTFDLSTLLGLLLSNNAITHVSNAPIPNQKD
ncbi:DNA-binding domain-containing protein [Marivita hallyeonensis]|uniref:Putative DNA-binding domain-containing protein n=1 Tax=Marivita hallyeonensis TaxID=996342 RepID=A0A1M5P2B7_9RHOB|nr:DNA-binding domain-containing protein [Marivita hallyeonensis]SHG95888.1 Putative DNA-binding domain-containing protein [Marivita hallyeonensis]